MKATDYTISPSPRTLINKVWFIMALKCVPMISGATAVEYTGLYCITSVSRCIDGGWDAGCVGGRTRPLMHFTSAV